jgi:hypothetical protein
MAFCSKINREVFLMQDLERLYEIELDTTIKHYNSRIDMIKGMCIIFVIILHTRVFYSLYLISEFVFRITVPIFYLLIGYNNYTSFEKKNTQNLNELYCRDYIIKKIKRYIIPYIFVYIICIVINLLNGTYIIFYLPLYITFSLIKPFQFPFEFKGNYFYSILIQSIFVLPLLYSFYKKRPRLTFIFSILISFSLSFYYEIYITGYNGWDIFTILYIFVFGFYLKDKSRKIKKYFLVSFLLFLILFLLYLIKNNEFNELSIDFLKPYREIFFYRILFAYYCFFITQGLLKYLPNLKNNPLICIIGKASLDIFIVQGLFFPLFSIFVYKSDYITIWVISFLLFDLSVCLFFGILLYSCKRKRVFNRFYGGLKE